MMSAEKGFLGTQRLFSWLMLCSLLLLAGCGRDLASDAEKEDYQPPGPLSAPVHLRVDIGDAHLLLHWSSVPGADNYRLSVETDGNGQSSEAAWAIIAAKSPYRLSGLENGVAHRITVAAVSGDRLGEARQSPWATPVLGLNDTGISDCVDIDGELVSCETTGLFGQDGARGRDALAHAGLLDKAGAGSAGFDLSRIGSQGETLESYAQAWSCVQDNHTGLWWEVKDNDQGLRDGGHTYSWYTDEPEVDWEGAANGGECFGSDCDTASYVQAVNAQGLCGHHDWRLPSRSELLSIAHAGRSGPALDSTYFPSTTIGWYWASDEFSDASLAWTVGLDYGHSYVQGKDSAHRVRLVRGQEAGEIVCPSLKYRLEDDRLVDEVTGLTWTRCSLGQVWSGGQCQGDAQAMTWEEALSADVSAFSPDELGEAYRVGWRLPNVNELASLVGLPCGIPTLDAKPFPDAQPSRYWSSSPFVDYAQAAWVVDFGSGVVHDSIRGNHHYVRLVRGQF